MKDERDVRVEAFFTAPICQRAFSDAVTTTEAVQLSGYAPRLSTRGYIENWQLAAIEDGRQYPMNDAPNPTGENYFNKNFFSIIIIL